MKFTLGWLKEYLDTNASFDEIVEKLTAIGLEVEGIEDPAKAMDGFVVGHVVSAEQHPDADRLKLCKVDTGTEIKQIVCGAPNARQGIKVAFAPIGSYIPGIDVTLKAAKIRGVDSEGMMCSERELCLSDEHNGIIELSENAKVGSSLAPAMGMNDPVIEIAITPNRADCAGILGIARDLAASGMGTFKAPQVTPVKAQFDSEIQIKIEEEKACPLFLGRVIKNVKNGPSPKWLQDRLKSIGLRPISILVDITNYFCIGLNRPLHVFDADKLQGNLTIGFSKGGETLSALNDKEYTLKQGMTCIFDDSGVLGLGGIVGGTSTGCTDKTTNVILECAYFDPIQTATTGRALQIDSDARYRFERGIDPAFTHDGMELATQMVLDLCGGEAGSVVQAGNVPDISTTYEFDPAFTTKLSGVDLAEDQQIDILNRLGFSTEKKGNVYAVTSPSWRHDIEGKADYVEEVLRIHGYDQLIETSVVKEKSVTEGALDAKQVFVSRAKHMLAARGLHETITWSFLDAETADTFGIENKDALTLTNPISNELSTLRPSILPNLVKAAGVNHDKGYPNACVFEIGPVFRSIELVKGQETVATGIRTGQAVSKHWSGPARPVDVMDAKADVLALLGISGANLNPQVDRNVPDYYHPGRAGALHLGKNVLAYFGEIHPGVLESYGIDFPVVGFELFVEKLPLSNKKKSSAKKLLQTSPFQPLSRDFAFVVSAETLAGDCLRAVQNADKKLIADAEIFDVYQGKGVEEGYKSLAISVTLQPWEKTLTDDEIEEVSNKIIKEVENRVGGKLR